MWRGPGGSGFEDLGLGPRGLARVAPVQKWVWMQKELHTTLFGEACSLLSRLGASQTNHKHCV